MNINSNNNVDYCVIRSSEKLYNVILQRLVDRYVNDKIEKNMNVPYNFNSITAQGVEIDPGVFLPGEDSINVTYTIRKDERGTLFVYREYKQETVCSTVPVLILAYPTPAGLVDIIFNKFLVLDINQMATTKEVSKEVEQFREVFYGIISF